MKQRKRKTGGFPVSKQRSNRNRVLAQKKKGLQIQKQIREMEDKQYKKKQDIIQRLKILCLQITNKIRFIYTCAKRRKK